MHGVTMKFIASVTLLYILQINPASNSVSFGVCIMLKFSVIYPSVLVAALV